MSIIAYPLNNITYNAEDAMLLNMPITSGVYGQTGNFNLTTNNMTLTVGTGLAFMRLTTAKGFTVYNNTPVALTLDAADSVLDRIDRIVLKWRSGSNAVALEVLKGTPSSTPSPVARSTGADNYDLVLYDILVGAGVTTISAAAITDQRLNPNLCGLMASNVTQIDTTALHNQIVQLINDQETTINTIAEAAALDVFTRPAVIAQYTPTRGVDYWTQADQDAIVAEVLAAFTDVSEVGQ